ncbi:addiction module antidote protein, HigA family [Pantoea ananatis]|uniref:HigA family addiction module antitoxin n=1 Tax=Pantoea ananas TaxID=553 RepID=UPI000CF49D86|nr:HigA family addiction module antitoxin [Pantoea ananatis]PQK74412.1 addiction module antidote protein, HigA family [Pantoea ananatis]
MNQHSPPHPGKLVADNITALNLTMYQVAAALDVSLSTLQRITKQQISISAEMAVRLSYVIGSSPEWWMRMQDAYSLYHAAKKIDSSRLKPLFNANSSSTEQ